MKSIKDLTKWCCGDIVALYMSKEDGYLVNIKDVKALLKKRAKEYVPNREVAHFVKTLLGED